MTGSRKEEGCVFCNRLHCDDREHYILHRGEHWYILLNLYPYNSGHLLLVLNRHQPVLSSCSPAEIAEMGPLLHLMDDRVVSAVGLSTGCRTAPDLGTTDLEAGLFETEKGSIIRLTNGFSLAHPMATYYGLCGTRGSVKMQRAHEATFIWYSEEARPAMSGWQRAPEEWQARPDGENPVAAMVREFVESLVGDAAPPIDVYRSLDFVLPGITAHESAQRGGEKMAVVDLRA